MKAITLILAICLPLQFFAQSMRYFEVGMRLDSTQISAEWRDSSFIIAANDPALLALADAELKLPAEQRIHHINGALSAGNGGFNHNSAYWFSWHIQPNEWVLAENSIELCDGRPFSDVEQDTTYWIENVGRYCSWASYLKREVFPATPVKEPSLAPQLALNIFPNPAGSEAFFTWEMPETGKASLTLSDLQGKWALTVYLGEIEQGPFTKSLTTGAMDRGMYAAVLQVNGKTVSRQFELQ
jgi:hypothetical protein